jgi:hypothetical protein
MKKTYEEIGDSDSDQEEAELKKKLEEIKRKK